MSVVEEKLDRLEAQQAATKVVVGEIRQNLASVGGALTEVRSELSAFRGVMQTLADGMQGLRDDNKRALAEEHEFRKEIAGFRSEVTTQLREIAGFRGQAMTQFAVIKWFGFVVGALVVSAALSTLWANSPLNSGKQLDRIEAAIRSATNQPASARP